MTEGAPTGFSGLTKTAQQLVAQALANAQAKAAEEGDIPNIKFDRMYAPPAGPVTGNSVEYYNKPELLTTDASIKRGASWYNDTEKRQAVQNDLYSAGFIYNSAGLNNYSGFKGGLENALEAFQLDGEAQKNDETFTEWLHRKGKESDRSRPGDGSGGGGGGGSRTFVNLTNEFDAEVLVNNALGQYLGRDASEQEIQEFWKKLNKGERANPITTSAGGQSGGYNAQLAAEKFAEQDEEYAETTADITLKNLMGDAIRGRLNGGIEGML